MYQCTLITLERQCQWRAEWQGGQEAPRSGGRGWQRCQEPLRSGGRAGCCADSSVRVVRDLVDPASAALADFCLALLNRNEFIYVP